MRRASAILVVDATQGVEAQTLANVYLALDHDLEIIPVINKVDLPSAEPEKVAKQIEEVIGIDASEAPLISAKVGAGIERGTGANSKKSAAAYGDKKRLRRWCLMLHTTTTAEPYVFVRIMEGSLRKGMPIRMMQTGADFEVVKQAFSLTDITSKMLYCREM